MLIGILGQLMGGTVLIGIPGLLMRGTVLIFDWYSGTVDEGYCVDWYSGTVFNS